MINLNTFIQDCNKIQTQSPIVLSITNYLAMNFAANSLLAIGASPIMSCFDEEISDLSAICNSLVINIGCLDANQIKTMKLAAKIFSDKGIPWVLDPVGVGASKIRTKTALQLIEYQPSIIRANAAEIACLSGQKIQSRGVDSCLDSEDILGFAQELTLKTKAVVSMSGATDYICDGIRSESIKNGHRLMSKVTAMGCCVSSLTGAFVAVDHPFEAALHTMALVGVAGELAAQKSIGTASLSINFVDYLFSLDPKSTSLLIKQ